jgi:sporulation protein YlmC with PRC-barrel domain
VDANAIQIVAKRDNPRALARGILAHLDEIADDYMIADPTPDFRDWKVMGADGQHIGKVDDLIVDTSTMTVRCAEVTLDRDVATDAEDRFVLVPIELVRIDPDHAYVALDHLHGAGLADAPRHHGRVPTADEQRVVLAHFEITPAGAHHG